MSVGRKKDVDANVPFKIKGYEKQLDNDPRR